MGSLAPKDVRTQWHEHLDGWRGGVRRPRGCESDKERGERLARALVLGGERGEERLRQAGHTSRCGGDRDVQRLESLHVAVPGKRRHHPCSPRAEQAGSVSVG
eukprot:5811593-Prymnesium_polylepis.1